MSPTLDLPNLFETIASAKRAGQLVETIMGSDLKTAPVLQHPLGFLIAKLDDGRGTALRIHLWIGGSEPRQRGFEVHDHLFDLESFVVRGGVRQTVYSVIVDPEGALREYVVKYNGNVSRLQATDRLVHLRPRKTETFWAGQRYALPAHAFHQLDAITDRAMTVVLTRHHGGAPRTLGPRDAPDILESGRSPLMKANGDVMTLSDVGLHEFLMHDELGETSASNCD